MDITKLPTREDKLKFFEAAVKAEAEAKFDWDKARDVLTKINKKVSDAQEDADEAFKAWNDAEKVKAQLYEELRTVQNL